MDIQLPEYLTKHAEYLHSLSTDDTLIAIAFLNDNQDCGIETIKQVVASHHA